MISTAVFYGSTTGNTEQVAKRIAEKLHADIFDVANVPADKLADYRNLIFGTSTWGVGDLQDDWDAFMPQLTKVSLEGKTVALFGLGDSITYADSFVDGIGLIFEAIKDKGCTIVGEVDTGGYDFEDSRFCIDGKFIGLPLDADNQDDLTEKRIDRWIERIRAEFS